MQVTDVIRRFSHDAGACCQRARSASPVQIRNIPRETVPGKRAPTVEMCESDEQFVPLNEGPAADATSRADRRRDVRPGAHAYDHLAVDALAAVVAAAP